MVRPSLFVLAETNSKVDSDEVVEFLTTFGVSSLKNSLETAGSESASDNL